MACCKKKAKSVAGTVEMGGWGPLFTVAAGEGSTGTLEGDDGGCGCCCGCGFAVLRFFADFGMFTVVR